MLNVLSPDPILLRPSFRFHDANSVPQPTETNARGAGRSDPSPTPWSVLGDRRDLAGILLGLPCRALTRFVGRILVRHEFARVGARRRGGCRRARGRGTRGQPAGLRRADRAATPPGAGDSGPAKPPSHSVHG